MDPKFPLQEVKSLQDCMENAYVKDAHPEVVVGEEKATSVGEKETEPSNIP